MTTAEMHNCRYATDSEITHRQAAPSIIPARLSHPESYFPLTYSRAGGENKVGLATAL